MTAQHSPAPWKRTGHTAIDSLSGTHFTSIRDGNSLVIVRVWIPVGFGQVASPQALANIPVIEAAPKMLAALLACIDGWENWSEQGRMERAIDEARAAVAEAEEDGPRPAAAR